jgi:hypothetical protein
MTGPLVFLSHVKKETGLVAQTFFDFLQEQFKEHEIFLDVQQMFPLGELKDKVNASKLFLVLASPSYLKRPFCLVELVTAWKHF